MNLSRGSVANWSSRFEWEKRLQARDKEIASLVSKKVIIDEAESKADALKICRAIQVRFVEALKDRTALIGARDFEAAVKLELLLRGKATGRIEHVVGPIMDRIMDLMMIVIEREVKDPEARSRIGIGFQEAALSIGGHA